MLTAVVMPQGSLSMQVGIVMEWYKQVGDRVEKGEPLCEIEGDKATISIDAPVGGVLRKIIAKVGDEYPVRQPICFIGDADDVIAEASGSALAAAAAPGEALMAAETAQPKQGSAPGRASPVARRLAAEFGVDLAGVTGTGPEGLIGKEDVLRAHELRGVQTAGPVQAEPGTLPAAPHEARLEIERTVPVVGVKRLVGERMAASHREAPHIHLTAKCIVTEAMRRRREANGSANGDAHITVTDLLLWATGRALAAQPHMNSGWADNAIQFYKQINLGVAIASERGLIVGVIPAAHREGLPQIARSRQQIVERVTSGKQTAADTTGSTFTITNLGMMGVLAFDPIVPPGNAAILGAGKVVNEVIVDDAGRMGVEQTMLLTLACDHRVADGADGARFLATIVAALEQPAAMFGNQG